MTNLSQAQGIPAQGLPRTSDAQPKGRGYRLALPVFFLVLLLSWVANRQGYYTPGSDVGYYLGMVGGIMMLTLLLYPLRKHLSFLQPLGAIRHWFKLHMLFGVLGPLLIIIHSAFGIGSLNAGVAMACMLLVAGSGVIGRFIYTRIHHGLYGRKASLQEMQADLGIHTDEVRSKFHFAPAVETRLKTFGAQAQSHPSSFLSGAWQFMTLSLRARYVHSQCMRDVRKIVKAHAHKRQWERGKLQARLAAADHMISSYLESARHAAQFTAYERLFSLWHILHVPFVFMLVISGVVHVIAVHMY